MITVFNAYDVFNFPLIETRDDSLGAFRTPYLIFNSLEALCWLAVCLAILIRYLKHRRSRLEPLYALSFLAFAASDVIETSGTTVGLLLFKGACLLAIVAFRDRFTKLHGSRIF